jgi:hypothetical protein
MVMMFPHVGVYVITQWRVVVTFVAGLCVGHYATPDVRDQHRQINEGERLVKEHFGKRAFRLWVAIWWPMAWLIPHRSPWSHLPIVATCLAAVWLYWLPLALLWYYAPIWFDVACLLMPYHVAGWAVQDAVHLRQDGGLRKGIRW